MPDLPGPVDNWLGAATQTGIDLVQEGANAGADISIGTADWYGEQVGQFGSELTEAGAAVGSATTDPLLAFAGLNPGGGGGGGGQNQNQNQNQPQGGGGIPPVVLIAGAAVAIYVLTQMGGD